MNPSGFVAALSDTFGSRNLRVVPRDRDKAVWVAKAILRDDGMAQAPTLDGARILAREFMISIGEKA